MTQTEILTLVMKVMTSSKPRYGGVFELQESMIIDLVNMAIEQEREACAKLADGWPDYDVQGLAEAIRARGGEK